MSVYRPKGSKSYWYDFEWRGRRHRENTHQTKKTEAQLVERDRKLKLRRQLGGLETFDAADTPRFEDWAEIALKYQRDFIGRIDLFRRTLVVVFEFWGAEPSAPKKSAAVPRARRGTAPYHDLHLGDPIADPTWLTRFEQWMKARGVSGSTRNSYLSALSTLYRVALQPEYRPITLVASNPFRDIRRSPPRRRVVALEPATILQWVQTAPYHVALATTIAALAPKLRLRSILDLEWDRDFDKDLTRITIRAHKTAPRTGAPQITPISSPLRAVLKDARSRRPSQVHVITYGDKQVGSIKRSAKATTEKLGLTWGIANVTFHTIRHSVATLLAALGMPERIRMELMGHSEIRTTQQYTHLAALVQVGPHEELAAALPLEALMLAKPRPRAKRTVGGKLGDQQSTRAKSLRKTTTPIVSARKAS